MSGKNLIADESSKLNLNVVLSRDALTQRTLAQGNARSKSAHSNCDGGDKIFCRALRDCLSLKISAPSCAQRLLLFLAYLPIRVVSAIM